MRSALAILAVTIAVAFMLTVTSCVHRDSERRDACSRSGGVTVLDHNRAPVCIRAEVIR